MTKISELLEELKELDSNTYQGINFLSRTSSGFDIEENPNKADYGYIQGEIQRAIEKRGWYWGFSIGGHYTAVISKDMFNFKLYKGDSPAQTILMAYIEALKVK